MIEFPYPRNNVNHVNMDDGCSIFYEGVFATEITMCMACAYGILTNYEPDCWGIFSLGI